MIQVTGLSLDLNYGEECVSSWWNQYATQTFSSLVPRQKWFFVERNFRKRDIVLIQYEGKSKPGTYRLGVVLDALADKDGCVRNAIVEYSLLSDLSYAERLAYKGITKKKLRVCVQRLVLILPVEEREDEVSEVVTNFSCLGAAAAEKSNAADIRSLQEVRTLKAAGLYDNFIASIKSFKILGTNFKISDFWRDIYANFSEKLGLSD